MGCWDDMYQQVSSRLSRGFSKSSIGSTSRVLERI